MIMAVLQHRVPTREIRMKSQRKMWMTPELYHLSKRKFCLFKIARSTLSEDDWSKYARFRNFCTSRFRSAKANFLRRKHEEISSATDGSHRWWTLAKKQKSLPRVKPYRNYAQLSIPQQLTLTRLLFWPTSLLSNAHLLHHKRIYRVHLFLCPKTTQRSTFHRSRNSLFFVLCCISQLINPQATHCLQTLSCENAHLWSHHLCHTYLTCFDRGISCNEETAHCCASV